MPGIVVTTADDIQRSSASWLAIATGKNYGRIRGTFPGPQYRDVPAYLGEHGEAGTILQCRIML
jgi:hypothetical protein